MNTSKGGLAMFEGTQELAENKLLMLYIFDKIQCPISNTYITEIVLENNLLNYFHLQQYLSELVSSGFLVLSKQERKHIYSLSEKGKSALEYFENRISNNKKAVLNDYLEKHGELLKKSLQISADYFPEKENKYIVSCSIMQDNINLIEIKLSVNSNEQAKQICSKWKSNASEMSNRIIKMLTN
jgi:predicted transcriptional regulator